MFFVIEYFLRSTKKLQKGQKFGSRSKQAILLLFLKKISAYFCHQYTIRSLSKILVQFLVLNRSGIWRCCMKYWKGKASCTRDLNDKFFHCVISSIFVEWYVLYNK